jgi:pimeloyl-ACP methyl ester carboxylesterase
MARPALLSVVLAAAALLAGCGQDSDSSRVVPSFYEPPSPLPAGEPGAVIRTQGIEGAPPSVRAQRILFHSRTNAGEDVATSGILMVPSGTPPAGGFPLVSAAHGTTGTIQPCAPSLAPFEPNPQLPNGLSFFEFFYEPWLQAGYAVVGADYQGEGAPGFPSFLVGAIEGRNVLDAARAARALDGAIGPEILLFGHSQGGHAAGFAAQLAPVYAPELDVLGTVLDAPAANLTGLLPLAFSTGPDAVTPPEAVAFLYLAALSYQASYAELSIDSLLKEPYGFQGLPIFSNVCAVTGGTPIGVNQLLDAVIPVGLPFRPIEFFIDYSQFPANWRARIDENDLGGAPIDSPILMVQGCADTTIPIVTNFDYFEDTLCPAGETALFRTYPGQSHSGVVIAAFPDVIAWANDRRAGEPPPDNCGAPPTCP